ncbi:hypothetical protein QBC37DRAFT_440317 [Rhypophila decipiens]|uniref:Protein kinase domain-containing protein n=1 Tax=Rhypophila decipiens TaxID=261697 RepID=A0AAN6Y929_9PEZI|nr:hypothetical protein QBC37DRAFT_440317 [Rhypophila decipiens]
MELSSAVFRDILSPLSAFKKIRPTGDNLPDGRKVELGTSTSPENTGPSCTPTLGSLSVAQPALTRYKWTIQGADPDARRFFAVPLFALDAPPLRIDVYLPPLQDYGPQVRAILRPEEAIYSPRDEIPVLVVSRWLAGILEQWCTAYDSGHGNDGKFQREYESMPFGSRILVAIGGLPPPCSDSSGTSPGKVMVDHEIFLVPDYDVEQGMLTVDALRQMWEDVGTRDSGSVDSSGETQLVWPEVIDLEHLCLKRQIHEAISIVTISHAHARSKTNEENEYVFKSLTRDQRHLYNELKMLLSMKPHDNIMPRPRYIVTKKGRFGGRRGVCGFVLEYFSKGSLKSFLLAPSTGSSISLSQKVHWAKQITRALIHINTNGNDDETSPTSGLGRWCGFYPDLKPDNIVLRLVLSSQDAAGENGDKEAPMYDAVLLDLEQRGGWFSWSPPEIKYLEYLEILLSTSADDLNDDEFDIDKLEDLQDEFKENLSGNVYFNSDGGFSTPWLAFLAKRRRSDQVEEALDLEKAQVFMLGKLLWCIFEEEALMRCGIDHEMLSDLPDIKRKSKVFPRFENTPVGVRGMIQACTAGAEEWDDDAVKGWRVVLNAEGRLVPLSTSTCSALDVTAEDTQRQATEYWKGEAEKARTFVSDVGALLAKARSRPTLAEVLDELERKLE